MPVALADQSAHERGLDVAGKTALLMADVAEAPLLIMADDNGTDPVRTRYAGRIRPEQGLSEERWQVFAEGAHKIARAVLEASGAHTVFHHHCAGFAETPAEVDKFLELTDPDLVGLCLDTGHYTYGGGDAVEAIRRYAGRISHVHLKDCDPGVAADARAQGWDYFQAIERGVFCELGRGCVDFPGVLRELRAGRFSGWAVVEQDVVPGMGSPLDSAAHNREYLRRLGL